MSVALFVMVEAPGAAGSGLDHAAVAAVAAVAADTRGLRDALAYRPVAEAVDHPFTADGPGPALALELGFGTQDEAEAALRPDRLGRLDDALPADAAVSHQLFAPRRFPVAGPDVRVAAGEGFCTYLVRYQGRAEDRAAWLDFYDAHHPPIMCRFPGIRQVATYRPLAWRSDLAWARADALQRNKVVFDTPAALSAALRSPVMAEMRADRAAFPPFAGSATHHPMWTRVVR